MSTGAKKKSSEITIGGISRLGWIVMARKRHERTRQNCFWNIAGTLFFWIYLTSITRPQPLVLNK